MKHHVSPTDLSALQFDRVWVREATFLDSLDQEHVPDRKDLEQVEIQLEVTVAYSEHGDRAYVTLRATLEPPPDKPSFGKLAAAVEGSFTLRAVPDVGVLQAFATLQAPVLLVPYLRQVLTDLTAQSRLGAIVLPPLNMVEVIKSMQAQSSESETRATPR